VSGKMFQAEGTASATLGEDEAGGLEHPGGAAD
jgi:hypothetical protein